MDKGSVIVKLLILIAIVAGVVGGYSLMKRNVYVATSALTPSSVGIVSFEVNNLTNDVIPVNLNFRTGYDDSNVEDVTSMTIKLKINSATNTPFTITDQDGQNIFEATPSVNLSSNSEWEFPINKFESIGDGMTFSFAGVIKNKTGYSTLQSERLTTFYVKGLSSKDDLKLEFDEPSQMYSKRRPVTDIWSNR